jgi:hypothetical protein
VRSAREKRWDEQPRELAHEVGVSLARPLPVPLVAKRLRLARRLKPQTLAPDGWTTGQLPRELE